MEDGSPKFLVPSFSYVNFSGHGALLPTFAAGVATGNGASLIASNRKIGPHEAAFVCDFVPWDGDTDDVDGFTATANGEASAYYSFVYTAVCLLNKR